jgi:hypothetical protein
MVGGGRSRWFVFALCLLVPGLHAGPAVGAVFAPGDVFYVANNKVLKITSGGNFAAASALATIPSLSNGQIAFDADRSAAYVSLFNTGQVLRVAPDGTTTTFATGVSQPTGLLRLKDGRLLAVSFGGTVFDITAGGAITSANQFATGVGLARDLLQTSDGRILLAGQGAGKVFDITAGGNFSASPGFATGLGQGLADLVQDSTGRIFASQFSGQKIVNVTSGGDFSAATPFATGQAFMGLTVDGSGRLLASVMSGVGGTATVYDVSAGGIITASAAFASGVPGGESNVDAVAVPEPVALALVLLGAWALRRGRRRGITRRAWR